MPFARGGLVLFAWLVVAACARLPESAPRPDRPDEALRFRYRQRLSSDGTMPSSALTRAKAQRDALLAAQGLAPDALLGRSSWTWLGPGNVGGRIRSILIHPTSHATMWVGSVSGGIWKTTDSGATWTALDDFMPSLAVCCMALDPANPDNLYAGTGEGMGGVALRGEGIWVSSNGGTSWSQLAGTAPDAGATQWYYVNRIAIDHADPRVLLAATNDGIYRRAPDGSWSLTAPGPMRDVDFDPINASNAVLGGVGGAGWSDDGGRTWTVATGFPANTARIEVAYARSDPTYVYASVEILVAGKSQTGGLYRSTDRGKTYAGLVTGTPYLGEQGWYDNVVWVSPNDRALVVVGGIDAWRLGDDGMGNPELTKISDWGRVPDPGDSAHADHHAIVAHPAYGTNKTVFFGTDGGLYRAADITTVTTQSGWTSLNARLGITQFYGADVNSAGVLIGGTQDNGTLRYSGNANAWSTTFGGDGGFCAADPWNASTFFGEYVFAWVFRSTDGGASGDYIHGCYVTAGGGMACKAAPYNILDALASPARANVIAPLRLDPNRPNRLLVGCASLWRTDDANAPNTNATGPAWAAIKAPSGSFISAIAIAPGNSDLAWVGTGNNGGAAADWGEVFVSNDASAAAPMWARVDDNATALPNRYCSSIAIDPRDSRRVYVTFMGYEPDNVWRTTDAGASWQRITGRAGAELPSLPVSAIAVHPRRAGTLFIGTDLGVFFSENDGVTWKVPNAGPANVQVDQLLWRDPHTLLAVTHGRGVHAAALPETALKAVRVATGFSKPVLVTSPPGDEDRLFVCERQTALIRIIDRGAVRATPFLDLSGRVRTGGANNEQGLLSLAFDPSYAANGLFYVSYTRQLDGASVIERFQVSAGDRNVADPASGVIGFGPVAQPFANHNGGHLAFGPDGRLYWSLGDGGSSGDPFCHAQRGDSLLGKILRLDVSAVPFTAPADNPFVGDPNVRDEIWALGLKNPWRFSFDRATGEMYIGEPGQAMWEEIDLQPAGKGGLNYGWKVMEGRACFATSGCPPGVIPCNDGRLSLPIHTCPHTAGNCAVIGGFVYRGCAIPDLQGTYLFGDFCTGSVWSFARVDGRNSLVEDRTVELLPPAGTIGPISSFGEDARGELYICDYGDGEIYQIVAADGGAGADLGFGKVGGNGEVPLLELCGRLESGSNAQLVLRRAPSLAAAAFFLSQFNNPFPIFGGTIVPLPVEFVISRTTDAGGRATFTIPGGLGPAVMYAQAVIVDFGATFSIGMSNAIRIVFP